MENLRASEGILQDQQHRPRGPYKPILPAHTDFEILVAPKMPPVWDHQNNLISMNGQINGVDTVQGKDASKLIRINPTKKSDKPFKVVPKIRPPIIDV